MFIIFWRGIGIIVPLFGFVTLVLAVLLGEALKSQGIPAQWAGPLGFAATVPVAAGLIWYIAMRVGGRPKRILVDAATGEHVAIKADAGSFMFIPTRFWAFIMLALGLLFGYAMSTDEATHPEEAPASGAPAASSPAQ